MPVTVSILVAAAVAVVQAQISPMDGIWRTLGYGYVYEIHGVSLRAFEVTATTCLPGYVA